LSSQYVIRFDAISLNPDPVISTWLYLAGEEAA